VQWLNVCMQVYFYQLLRPLRLSSMAVDRGVGGMVIVGFVVTFLVGCSVTKERSSAVLEDGQFSASSVSSWANEIAVERDRATDEFAREVLEDGVISEQEFQEVRDRFQRCLGAEGIAISSYGFDDSFEFASPNPGGDRTQEVVEFCSRSSSEDVVGRLFSAMQRNPDNLDEDEIIFSCLVRSSVLPTGYSLKEFKSDSLKVTNGGSPNRYPFLDQKTGVEALRVCEYDPLGLSE